MPGDKCHLDKSYDSKEQEPHDGKQGDPSKGQIRTHVIGYYLYVKSYPLITTYEFCNRSSSGGINCCVFESDKALWQRGMNSDFNENFKVRSARSFCKTVQFVTEGPKSQYRIEDNRENNKPRKQLLP